MRISLLLYGLTAILLLAGCSREITVVKARMIRPANSAVTPAAVAASNEHIRDGLILYRQHKYAPARQQFRLAITADSSNWQGYYFLGLTAVPGDQFELALAQFQRALDFAPSDPRVRSKIYLAMAETHELMSDYGRAELNYRTALNLYPESAEAKRALDRLASRAAAGNR